MQRLLLLLFFCLVLCSSLQAQTSPPKGSGEITGTVIDSTSAKPVAFATITLLDASTQKSVEGAFTDEKGKFILSKLASGSYTLSISFMGYNSKIISNLQLTESNNKLSLPTIQLKSASTKLQEVTVVGQKPLVEDKGDRLVYNAEQDITNAGTTASDVLKKVPAVTVDADGNVQLRGSSNFRVLLDGKPSSILANNLAEALKQIPADNIRSVEVITSPSAKYDAEGTAGIINIITKKNKMEGVNGKVAGTLASRYRNGNANLSARKGKFGASTNFSMYGNNNLRRASVERVTDEGENIFRQDARQRSRNHGYYSQLELTFDPDTLNAFNISGSYRRNRYKSRGNQTTLDRILSNEFSADLENVWRGSGYDLNFGYTHTFKPQHELSFLAQINHNNSNDIYDNQQYTPGSERAFILSQRNDNNSPTDEKTFQVDYTRSYKNQSKLELGAKAILRDAVSNTSYNYSFPSRTDSVVINNFDYDQDVTAGYATYGFSLKKKYNFNLGSRFEHTEIKGLFLNTEWDKVEKVNRVVPSSFKDNYSNFIPSISISRTIDTIHTVRVSYTQRIQRPQIWILNPFLQMEDFNNAYQGNPQLDAELTHSYEVGYNTFFKTTSINASVFMRQTDNAIQNVVRPQQMFINGQEQQVLVVTYDNIAKNRAYGFSLSGSTKPLPAWTISPSFNLNYVNIKSDTLSNSGVQYNISLNTSYEFKKGLTAQFYGGYYSKGQALQGEWGDSYYTSFTVRKKLFKDKGGVSIGINNPFSKTIDFSSNLDSGTYNQYSHNYSYNRTVRISFDFNFGKMQISQRQKKTIQNDDAAGSSK